MKKRGFSLLLTILILTVQIPFAFAVTASGTCGDNLTWTLDDSGTLTISGTGPMNNFTNSAGLYAPWYSYQDDIRTVIVDNGVTSIGKQAFYYCRNLTNITIPNSVTSIGSNSFENCGNLTNITIPNGVTDIGEWAFHDCGSLTNITIPNSVTSIGLGAFSGCDSLTNITIPNGVTTIGSWAFQDCDSLTDIMIPNSVTSIKNSTFSFCSNLTNITIPNSVTSIGEGAFCDCDSLTNITIPNSVTSIGEKAFIGCSNLTNITIPNSVTSIDVATFQSCSNLTNITISNSITVIGWAAFDGCENLTSVYYGGSQNQWESIKIYDSNEYLTNATIHYNSAEPDSNPVTPTPVAPESFPPESQPITPAPTNSAIGKYSYAFANEGKAFGYPAAYRFPLERFQLVYGNGFAKKMKAVDFGGGAYWSGNCYGMATTAAMLSRAGSGVTPSDFRNGATRPGELQVSDSAAKLGLTLAQFIEAMQISQYSATFAATRKQNRDNLSGLLSAMSAFEEGGFGPLVICVYGNDKNGVYSGHALLAYHLDGQRLYVYDCNHPNDESRYITISNSGWSYPISDGVTWNNSNGDITYIQYETYLMDWYSRGRLLGDPEQLRQVMFFINAADATISDSYGNEIAAFQKGKMIRGIDEAYPIPQLGVTADGVSVARPQIAVWLPLSNGYSVTTRESATVSSVNLSRGVSVSQVAGGQTVSVSLSSYKPQFDDVFPGQYFYDPVMWAVGREITNGTTAATFEPAKTCTRNHILTFLWRANGSPAASIGNPFTDVNPDTTFGKAALWAAEKGLVSGTRFNGDSPCTRAEAVTYLWKLAGRPTAGRSAFTDVPSNADYAQAVSWAVERGVTKGTSETTFNPSGTCTRGQIVTFLYRAYGEA